MRRTVKSAPRLYSKLPDNIKNSENLQMFKKKLKTHLFTECYDLNEKCIRQEYMYEGGPAKRCVISAAERGPEDYSQQSHK